MTSMRTLGRCKATGKVKFATRLEALMAIARPSAEASRCYHCPECGRWHLARHATHKPRES